MPSLSRQCLGAVLILIAVVGIVGSFTVSAATAPSTGMGAGTAQQGRTLVGTQVGGRISMFNSSGARLWTTSAGNVDYFDATMLKNGSVVAGFIQQGQQTCGRYQPPCARTGFRVIDPTPKPHITGQWSFPVRTKLNSEVHDVNLLPDGHC